MVTSSFASAGATPPSTPPSAAKRPCFASHGEAGKRGELVFLSSLPRRCRLEPKKQNLPASPPPRKSTLPVSRTPSGWRRPLHVGEGRQVDGGRSALDDGADDIGRYRGEENAVAIVAGGEHEAGDLGGAQEWGAGVGVGPKVRPGASERRVGQGGEQFDRGAQEVADGAGGDLATIAHELERGSHENTTIVAGNQVARGTEHHAPQDGFARFEFHDLPARGADGVGRERNAPDECRPASRRQHDVPGGDAGAILENDAARLAVDDVDGPHVSARSELRPSCGRRDV